MVDELCCGTTFLTCTVVTSLIVTYLYLWVSPESAILDELYLAAFPAGFVLGLNFSLLASQLTRSLKDLVNVCIEAICCCFLSRSLKTKRGDQASWTSRFYGMLFLALAVLLSIVPNLNSLDNMEVCTLLCETHERCLCFLPHYLMASLIFLSFVPVVYSGKLKQSAWLLYGVFCCAWGRTCVKE